MAASDRDEFLLTVRRSLERPGETPPVDRERLLGSANLQQDSANLRAKLESRTQEQMGSLLDSLERELSRVGGRVARIGSQQELERYLNDLVSAHQVKSIVRWDTPLLAELEPVLEKSGVNVTKIRTDAEDPSSTAKLREALIAADLGITEVDYAIADTGSLVLLAGERQGRLASLLPPVHVALLKPSALVPSMADLLPVVGAENREQPGQLSSCITFITGPSRTADIEKIITIGIHGPVELHALVLEYL